MQIRKTNHLGVEKARYTGTLVKSDQHKIVIETQWPDGLPVNTSYGLVINPGDALIEHFYVDRWCNIMAVYDPRVNGLVDQNTLKGWYCNITRPTLVTRDPHGAPVEIEWQDLALDVWMDVAGVTQVLDEDEFENIKPQLMPLEIASVLGAVKDTIELCRHEWRAYMNDTIAQKLGAHNWTIATAESCTGGLIGDTLTNRPGSSDYFIGGILSYDNRIKRDVLHVPEAILATAGAVSEACARAMARGVRVALGVDVGISATGIAGPGGGNNEKPVGLVYLGISTPELDRVERFVWLHDRIGNKRASADAALCMLTTAL